MILMTDYERDDDQYQIFEIVGMTTSGRETIPVRNGLVVKLIPH